jgi:transcriptional regulator with XRE-family HTH domain
MFLVINKHDHVEVIESQLKNRGWKPADLARRSGKNPSVISKLLNRVGRPDVETLQAVALALDLPEEELLRAAGQMKAKPSIDERRARLTHKASLLEDEKLDEYERYLDFLLQEQERRQMAPAGKIKKSE